MSAPRLPAEETIFQNSWEFSLEMNPLHEHLSIKIAMLLNQENKTILI